MMTHFDEQVNNTVHDIYQSAQNQMLTEHKVNGCLVWTEWSVGLTKNSYFNRQVKTENVIKVEKPCTCYVSIHVQMGILVSATNRIRIRKPFCKASLHSRLAVDLA